MFQVFWAYQEYTHKHSLHKRHPKQRILVIQSFTIYINSIRNSIHSWWGCRVHSPSLETLIFQHHLHSPGQSSKTNTAFPWGGGILPQRQLILTSSWSGRNPPCRTKTAAKRRSPTCCGQEERCCFCFFWHVNIRRCFSLKVNSSAQNPMENPCMVPIFSY